MGKRYAHACPDWDYMQIDEDCTELVGCTCFSEPEFLKIREQHSLELDRANEESERRSALARRFRVLIDGTSTEVVLAVDYDKLEALCVDFTRAVGEALIATNQRSQSDRGAASGDGKP